VALTSRDYTKARTIAELRRRTAKGKVVRFDELPKPLQRAVQRHWRTMAGARRAAGLPELVPGRRRWTRSAILTEIRKLARSGQHMSQNAVTKAGRTDLVVAACKHLGSWSRARDLAGVAIKKRRSKPVQAWDADSVVAEIRRRHDEDEPLAVTKVPSSLTSAAQRTFGSWRNAIEAAGLDYDRVLLRRQLSDEELADWLRDVARRFPTVTIYGLEKNGEHFLACRRRWTSIEAAAHAAGLSDWPRRERRPLLSREEVIAEIRRRRRAKLPLTFNAVRNERGTQLSDSALKCFVTWDDALAAAGA